MAQWSAHRIPNPKVGSSSLPAPIWRTIVYGRAFGCKFEIVTRKQPANALKAWLDFPLQRPKRRGGNLQFPCSGLSRRSCAQLNARAVVKNNARTDVRRKGGYGAIGSASDSKPEGWEFEPPCPHHAFVWFAVPRVRVQLGNREAKATLKRTDRFDNFRVASA